FVTEKSLEGSIAFFLFGLFGALLFNILFATSEINYVLILICITVTTILEALSPKDLDNLIIPVAVIVLYSIFN
ncbi:MAG: phosphatidate cytidylyltransferase, partial [Ignavibacteria bacterium]